MSREWPGNMLLRELGGRGDYARWAESAYLENKDNELDSAATLESVRKKCESEMAAAYMSLMDLTGQDFGYDEERWREWLLANKPEMLGIY